jgi:hypothetical protein
MLRTNVWMGTNPGPNAPPVPRSGAPALPMQFALDRFSFFEHVTKDARQSGIDKVRDSPVV